jgi:hypothetical protein
MPEIIRRNRSMVSWSCLHSDVLFFQQCTHKSNHSLVTVFGHHPWFLYDEEEDPETLVGASPYPEEWLSLPAEENSNNISGPGFPDSYFSMPKRYRAEALDLFRQYNVDACFSGHFHQNLVSKTRWGMDMIVTAPLSVVFESTGKKLQHALHDRRRVGRKMTFESEEAMLFDEESANSSSFEEPNCRGVRVVDVEVNETATSSSFRHWFVPL